MPNKQIPKTDPQSFFRKLSSQEKNASFLYSYGKQGWIKTIAFNPVATFSQKITEQPEKVLKKFQAFLKKHNKCKIIGYFSYDLGALLHKVHQKAKDDLKLPDIHFHAYPNWIEFKNSTEVHYQDKSFLGHIDQIKSRKNLQRVPFKTKKFKPEMPKTKYQKSYKKIKKYIEAGDIYQINFSHRLKGQSTQNSRDMFLEVLKKNPVDFLAYIEGPQFQVLSASPERFLKITKRQATTCPIKGTRPTGTTPKSDQQLKNQLLKSDKEQAELNMITDLLRNDLGQVSEIGSVKVQKARAIKKCGAVWHTYSKITSTILKHLQPIEALINMLPGGSISGCPKKRAIEIIDELEPTKRGIYTGKIGMIEPNGDIDFNIAIRTIIKKGQNIYLQVGGGIVVDSKEQAEFEETFNKAKSFM